MSEDSKPAADDTLDGDGPIKLSGGSVPLLGASPSGDVRRTQSLPGHAKGAPQTLALPAHKREDTRDVEQVTTGDPTAVHTAVAPARIRPGARRAAPVLGVVAAGCVVFGVMATLGGVPAPPPAPEAPPPGSLGVDTVRLPAAEVTIGLTEDNKERVLSACHRLAERPNETCRRQALIDDGEYPARTVSFPALIVDRHEVSNAEWRACEQAEACVPRAFDRCEFWTLRGKELREPVPEAMRADDKPASCVMHHDAEGFCAWRGMRLPTADEWERIARSGDERLHPWSDWSNAPGIMNWGERVLDDYPIPGRLDGYELTAPVDSYPHGASDDGVRNLAGNVAEWVSSGPRDPDATHAGVRGGSYRSPADALRTTRHTSLPRESRRSDVGFRCVAVDEG